MSENIDPIRSPYNAQFHEFTKGFFSLPDEGVLSLPDEGVLSLPEGVLSLPEGVLSLPYVIVRYERGKAKGLYIILNKEADRILSHLFLYRYILNLMVLSTYKLKVKIKTLQSLSVMQY